MIYAFFCRKGSKSFLNAPKDWAFFLPYPLISGVLGVDEADCSLPKINEIGEKVTPRAKWLYMVVKQTVMARLTLRNLAQPHARSRTVSKRT